MRENQQIMLLMVGHRHVKDNRLLCLSGGRTLAEIILGKFNFYYKEHRYIAWSTGQRDNFDKIIAKTALIFVLTRRHLDA